MSNFTQKAIEQTFVELLEERSLDKITIIDITQRCGINRNTFYYHYHDIYDLLDSILAEEEQRVVAAAQDDYSSWQQSFVEATNWALAHRKAVRQIYLSVNRDRLEHYLFTTAQTSTRRFVDQQAQGLDVPEEYRADMTRLLAAVIEALICDWLRGDMKDDPKAFIEHIAVLMNGIVHDAFEKVDKREQNVQDEL